MKGFIFAITIVGGVRTFAFRGTNPDALKGDVLRQLNLVYDYEQQHQCDRDQLLVRKSSIPFDQSHDCSES